MRKEGLLGKVRKGRVWKEGKVVRKKRERKDAKQEDKESVALIRVEGEEEKT